MKLKDQIVADLTTAMKNSAEVEKQTLRMLKAEIMKDEVSGKERRKLSDSEIVKIVKKLIKQRRDAAEQFNKGGRAKSATKEQEEIKILENYLPEQLSEEKIVEMIISKKAELNITDRLKMGVLIGAVMREIGDMVDGSMVKGLVEKSF